jgi:DNA replication and repair protein RecF
MLLVKSFYIKIADKDEGLELLYESQIGNQAYPDLLSRSRDKDILTQRTNGGIHKDDLVFKLGGQSFKSLASQGQRKSLLFALKLAEFQSLKSDKGFAPILMLDDVFEKLDEKRISNLLNWVCLENDGQIFITDTHPERINENIGSLGIKYQQIDI